MTNAVAPAAATVAAERPAAGIVAGSREVPSRRTERSTVFDNPDGTKTTRYFGSTTFLPDAAGDMRTVDTTLRRGADNRFTPQLAAKASIAARADDRVLASLDLDGASIGFRLEGAAATTGSVSGDAVRFAKVRPGANLRLSSLADGMKEEIVLAGPDAPTSWRFPLTVNGLTPELASAQSSVLFKNKAGEAKAAIPAGVMTDATTDPRTHRPTMSRGVYYKLERDGDGWVLQVDIDQEWLRNSARRFPITVDPTVRMIAWGTDTLTSSAKYSGPLIDYSLDPLLEVGTFGGAQYASYLTFDFWSSLSYKYILGASLNLYNESSYTCASAATTVYAVRQDWGYGAMAWPGKTYDSARPLVTATLPSKACPDSNGNISAGGWHTFQLPRARFTEWANGDDQPVTGFTIRQPAGSVDRYYYSSNTSVTTGRPYLDVTYADQGADYSLPDPTFLPPVTATGKGTITARVKKWGLPTWTPTNGYKLAAIVKNSAGAQLSRTLYPMPETVERGWTVDIPISVGPLPVATNYQLKLTMVDPSNRDFDAYYSVPAGLTTFSVGNGPPIVAKTYPAHDGYVDQLRPALWAQYSDPDNFPAGATPKYSYRICNGTPEAPTGCQSSAWVTSAAWQVPAGVLAWSRPSFWYVTLSDTSATSPEYGPFTFTPLVAQPEVSSHLAGAPDDADAPGLNPQVGNYSTTTTDLSVTAVGPALAIQRTYNSQDLRTDGAFGPGWSSPLDQHLDVDGDGSGNVVVTLSTGRTVRFGQAGGGYVPPPGMNLTLVSVLGPPATWVLRDPSGERRTFDDRGRLVIVEDSSGRRQTLTYDGTSVRPNRIRDEVSGRSLWPIWVGGRLATVAADPPAAGQAAPMWTYTYEGDRLTKVCSPLSADACTGFTYTDSSHYRSVVLDDNPDAYWPLGGTSPNLENVVARSPGENQAIAHGVTSGQPGPLAGSPDGGRGFTGAADSYVSLPDNLLSPSVAFSIELWFKAAAGKSGVLFGSQSVPIPTVPTSGWAPNLMIGTDGKLRGYQWTIGGSVSSAMISPGTVTDGQWHHTVLTMAVDKQTLYLDGDKIGEITGKIVDHRGMTRHFLGNGYTNSWPAAGTGYFPFTGQIDEVAFYRHPLSATQVAAHVTARAATSRLATVVEPGSFTATSATYDHASGRVTSMIDRNGATWTLGTPVVGDRVRLVTLSSTARDAITYTYDADHNGRLAVRTDGYGTADWEYNAAGFVYNYTDPDNQTRYFFTDNRGNRTADIVNYLGDWRYRYYGYMSFPDDPLDPRNDQLAWASDGRDSDTSTDFRTWYLRDTKGRVTNVVKPKLVGAPDWTARRDITYTNGTEPAIGGGTTPAGLVATDGNFSGGTTRYYYNSAGDRMKSVDPVGLTTEYTYDTLGRPLTSKVTGTVDGAVVDYGTTTTTYNAASLPETVTEPAVTNPLTSVAHTKRTRYTYDDGGRTTQIDESDLTGNDETRTTKTGYDPAGRIHSLTTADGKVTTQDWDEAGNLIRQTKPNGLVLEYGYDDHNHLVQTTAVGDGVDPMDPDATRMVVESRAYDPAGQLASVVDAMGRETAYTYYWTGLLETIKHVKRNTDGSIASTVLLDQRVYDYAGNLVRDTQAGGVVHDYLYDNLGNVIQDVLDPAGLARSTFYTRRGDGQPSATDATNGQAIGVGTPAEADLLYANNGSLIDRSNHRYADATTSFTYRFVLPPDATSASFTVEIDNQFLVETSTNNTSWTKVLEETRDIRDGSNRVVRTLDLSPTLATAKTIYVRFRDSQTATSWGARVIRSQLRFQRAGAPVESASFGYDTAGRPTSTTKIDPAATPKELVTTVTRDPRGLAMTTKDPAGAVTTFGYDRAGQLERTVEPPRPTFRDGTLTDNQSPTTLVGHDTFGEVTEQRDAADGSVTHIIRDQMGREHQRTLPSYSPPGGVTVMPVESIEYDDSGLPKSQKDALGRVTTYVHDKYGWLSSTTQPDPDGDGPKTAPVTQQKYNRVGEVLETIDPRGARVLATYDDQGIQVTETKSERVDGNTLYYTTTMVPDDRGRITSVTTPLSDKTTIDYNTADERTKVTDPDAVTTEFRYNATGRVTAGVTGGALATGYVFDSLGRNTAVTSHTVCGGVLSAPLRTATTGYDRDGRVVRETSAAGRITDYTYDAGGQVRTIAQRRVNDDESTAVSVKLDYDASGRRTRMIDGNEHATEYQYNSWGSPTAVVEPVTAAHPDAADQTWTTVYDTAGQATHILIPGSVTIDRSYDDLGQVIAETGSGAEGTTTARTFDYDAAGNITRAGTVGGDNTYEWNDRGLLTSTSGPGGTASFGYDSDGRLHTRTDGAGSTTFTYTDAGRLRTATDPLVSKTLTYTYRPATGDLQQITQGTGAPTRTFGYDALGRPASDTLTKANGAESAKITYGYDNDDLLTSSTTTGITGDGANGYGYDGLGRQTSWTKPGGATVTYGYDGASNRTSVTTTAGTRTFTFDARNRLTGASGGGDPDLTNTWSARGTLRSSTQDTAASTYTFDAFDQMLTAAEPGHTVEYRYDSLGRAATRNGVAFGYADQRNAPVNVPGDGAAPRGQIFRDPDSQPLSATLDGSPGRSLYQDTRHGDVRGWYDPSDGGLSRSAVYDPAGEVVAGSADRLPLGFQGGWSDPQTGLLNALSRWYDPGAPGFASRDTYTLSPDPVTQVNRYAYGNASPLNYIDVDGHNPLLLAAGFLFEVPVVGEAALVVVGVAAVGYIGYKAYQSYEYHHNVANSAGSWSGPATTTQPRTSVPDDYAARQQAAARAQAAVAAQQAATQARINAAVAAMNAAYNKWLAAYLAAVRAETARTAAEAARAYDIQLATEKAAAIKAATPGPVGTTVVKPPKVVALVGGAGTVTNTGATIQLPGTVYAGVDGADAPNTAAAAGAVAATNALQIAGGNNGDKDDCDDEVVEELAEWVDPDLINFSQRTVSPNNFAQSMRDGTWDWNRPGTALRVIERDGQLVSYDNRRLDAAREVRAEDPTYRVKIERLDPNALMPAKTTGMTWDQAFEKRMKRKRNWDENGCRVPWQGLFERPRWEE